MERFWLTLGFCLGAVIFVGYLLGIVDKNGLHWQDNQITALYIVLGNEQKQVGIVNPY